MTILALGLAGTQALADQLDPGSRAEPQRGELEVTLRIIEDPRAFAPEAVTRHITLPPVVEDAAVKDAAAEDPAVEDTAVEDVTNERDRSSEGREISREAREMGQDFGEETSERAREMSEQAREKRENLGRSRAEEMRRDRPRPTPPPGR